MAFFEKWPVACGPIDQVLNADLVRMFRFAAWLENRDGRWLSWARS